MERSALQRVIQLLKYHRDVYYAKLKDGDDLKPISAIINAVVAQIASQHTPDCSVFELLEFVLNEFNIYAHQEKLTFKEFSQVYGKQAVVAVGCKLIRVFYAILTHGVDYDANRLRTDIIHPQQQAA